MKAKSAFWQETAKPVVVLLLICLFSGLILAAVNSVTAPIIAANQEAQAQATYIALLPEADSFSELSTTVEGVSNVLQAWWPPPRATRATWSPPWPLTTTAASSACP